jgi:hypothetical protein
MNIIAMRDPDRTQYEANRRRLAVALCSWFVRRDGKFYSVDNLNVALSNPDVKQIALERFRTEFPEIALKTDLVRDVFQRTIEVRHTQLDEVVAIWGGQRGCMPGTRERIVRRDGIATINTWVEPAYRRLGVEEADLGVVGEFFDWIFTRPNERDMVLDWLAWNLQHENDKPTWAVFLYSKSKGSGKSTFAEIAAALFGTSNSVTQNNVDALTRQFNMTVLQSKLVICEELKLRQDSSQSNTLKTYITEATTIGELKNREAERVPQRCSFIFTTNHLPLWIEAEDRRFYVVEVDHDGHAMGDRAAEFSALVARVKAFLEVPANVARLYNALIARVLAETFSAKTMNIARDSTAVMRQIQAATRQVSEEQLAEHLNERGLMAVTESDVMQFVQRDLRGNINSVRHLMTAIGWLRHDVKWGGVDYTRGIWVAPGCGLYRGELTKPDGTVEKIAAHIQRGAVRDPFGMNL